MEGKGCREMKQDGVNPEAHPEDSTLECMSETELDAVCKTLLSAISNWSPGSAQDLILQDSFPMAAQLLIQSFEETENRLDESSNLLSTEDLRSRINSWQASLQPWHEHSKNLMNLDTVPYDHLEKLLDTLPSVVHSVFSHCKRCNTLYGSKFDDLRSQLTDLYRRSNLVLDLFFGIIGAKVDFDGELERERNALEAVIEKIGDIAALTSGMDLKSLVSTWKVFAKLAVSHASIIKERASTGCVTRRYADIAKAIETLLCVSLREGKDTNYEKVFQCVGLLLKILNRLCMLYRANCANEVFIVLVQLLAKLHRYSPPFPSERLVIAHSEIAGYSKTYVVPVSAEILTVLIGEQHFPETFFQYGQTDLKEPICYHMLTLGIVEKLIDAEKTELSPWVGGETDNIIEVALSNVNRCCANLLIDELRIPARSSMVPGKIEYSGIYETSLRLLARLVLRMSLEDFAAVELALLKHLLSGEFWSSLLSCDVWTHLARSASPELRYEHLCFFMKVQRVLKTRETSLEFAIIGNLIGRLYKSLPDETREVIFREFQDYPSRRFVDPFRAVLSPRAQQTLRQRSTIDAAANLSRVFQDLRRTPSTNNWIVLTSALKSIGSAALPQDQISCILAIRSIWLFVASSLPRSDGITREMLLELAALLLDCTTPDSSDNSTNDRLVASIYTSMLEIVEHAPVQHRLKINVFFRENLEPWINESGKQSLVALTELFCRLMSDDDPWLRQESFETYAESFLGSSSVRLFDALSIGINQSSRVCQQMQFYLANQEIHSFARHSNLEDYLRKLAATSRQRATWHKCYQADFRQRDEKMPRRDTNGMEERVERICQDIRLVAKRKSELSESSIDKLRAALLTLLEPSG